MASEDEIIQAFDYVSEAKFVDGLKQFDWLKLGKLFLGIVGIVILILIVRYVWRKYREIKEEMDRVRRKKEKQEKQLLNHLKTSFESANSSEVREYSGKIKSFIDSLPEELTVEHGGEISYFFSKVNKTILEKETEEEAEEEKKITEEQREKKEEKLKNDEIKRKIGELFDFKKAKNSVEALPLDKKYDEKVKEEAKYLMEEYLREKKRINEIKKEAVHYYKNNPIDTKPDIPKEQEFLYTEVRKEIEEGKRSLEKKPEYKGKPLPRNFYRAKGLDEEIKKKALAQGFQYVNGIELNGQPCAGGFYIRKNMEKESNYHFIMKHLFQELADEMKVEYCVEGKRVDTALIKGKLRLGIEIETGTNKIEQLAGKIPWLNGNFSQWIFVCSRDNLGKYNKLVDGKKSFCLTQKRAKEKVLEIINGSTAVNHR